MTVNFNQQEVVPPVTHPGSSLTSREVEQIIRLHFAPRPEMAMGVTTKDLAETLGITEAQVADLVALVRSEMIKASGLNTAPLKRLPDPGARRIFIWIACVLGFCTMSALIFLGFLSMQNLVTPQKITKTTAPPAITDDLTIKCSPAPRLGPNDTVKETLASSMFSSDPELVTSTICDQMSSVLLPPSRTTTTNREEGDAALALSQRTKSSKILQWSNIMILENQGPNPARTPLNIASVSVPIYTGREMDLGLRVRAEQKRIIRILVDRVSRLLEKDQTL